MSEEVLFSKNDIFQVIEGQKAAVKQRVQEIPANKLLNASERDPCAGARGRVSAGCARH